MVSAIDKTWAIKEKTYQDRHRRTMFEVSADEDKQAGFYQRVTDADLYRVSVLTTRVLSRTGPKQTPQKGLEYCFAYLWSRIMVCRAT